MRDRTANLRLARAALSQLSYSPLNQIKHKKIPDRRAEFLWVGLSGIEPLTSRLSGVRSNQLSYRPIFIKDQNFCT
jgi:hypothetical protein